MANITRSTLPSQLLEGIKENFGVKYKEVPLIAETVFDVETSGKEVERYQEVGGFGLHNVKAEGKDTDKATVNEGPTTYIENIAYALGYDVTHEELADNLYPQILKKALDLGVSARQTIETVVLDRLITGFSTDAADLLANGQALFSLAQPLSGGGGTDQNRPTVAASLSEASLTIDTQNIAKFRDPAGKRIDVQEKTLVVPVELKVRAQKLMQTDLSVGTANNDMNPFKTGRGFFSGGFVSSPFFTDPDAHFIRTTERGLVYQKREGARIMDQPLIRSMTQEVISYMRFGVGAYDYRSVYGNPGQ